jgi:hypothetical protein
MKRLSRKNIIIILVVIAVFALLVLQDGSEPVGEFGLNENIDDEKPYLPEHMCMSESGSIVVLNGTAGCEKGREYFANVEGMPNTICCIPKE